MAVKRAGDDEEDDEDDDDCEQTGCTALWPASAAPAFPPPPPPTPPPPHPPTRLLHAHLTQLRPQPAHAGMFMRAYSHQPCSAPPPLPMHIGVPFTPLSLFQPASDDEYWSEDDEDEVSSPIDAVDPFIYFAGGLHRQGLHR